MQILSTKIFLFLAFTSIKKLLIGCTKSAKPAISQTNRTVDSKQSTRLKFLGSPIHLYLIYIPFTGKQNVLVKNFTIWDLIAITETWMKENEEYFLEQCLTFSETALFFELSS